MTSVLLRSAFCPRRAKKEEAVELMEEPLEEHLLRRERPSARLLSWRGATSTVGFGGGPSAACLAASICKCQSLAWDAAAAVIDGCPAMSICPVEHTCPAVTGGIFFRDAVSLPRSPWSGRRFFLFFSRARRREQQ